jgi:hypothetical protein
MRTLLTETSGGRRGDDPGGRFTAWLAPAIDAHSPQAGPKCQLRTGLSEDLKAE